MLFGETDQKNCTSCHFPGHTGLVEFFSRGKKVLVSYAVSNSLEDTEENDKTKSFLGTPEFCYSSCSGIQESPRKWRTIPYTTQYKTRCTGLHYIQFEKIFCREPHAKNSFASHIEGITLSLLNSLTRPHTTIIL
jgi:hypothetical protein